MVVTRDADFNDLVMLQGFPPKVIWVRVGNCTTKRVAEILVFKLDPSTGVLSLQD